MFVVVGDQIVEREPVMASDKIDALFRLALLVSVKIRAAHQPMGDGLGCPVVAFDKGAHVIAESAIPFLPTISHEAADLIKASGVPRFCHQLDARQRWIRLNIPKDGRGSARSPLLVTREN